MFKLCREVLKIKFFPVSGDDQVFVSSRVFFGVSFAPTAIESRTSGNPIVVMAEFVDQHVDERECARRGGCKVDPRIRYRFDGDSEFIEDLAMLDQKPTRTFLPNGFPIPGANGNDTGCMPTHAFTRTVIQNDRIQADAQLVPHRQYRKEFAGL